MVGAERSRGYDVMTRVLVVGSGFFKPGFELLAGEEIQLSYLDKDREWKRLNLIQKIRLFASHDIVHFFWARVAISNLLLALLMRKSVIQHYIGSDVLLTLKSKRKVMIQKLLARWGVNLFAGSEQLSLELKDAGIDSITLPFVNRDIRNAFTAYPKELTVLTYVPDGKEEFYGLPAILACARKFPHIRFTILRNTRDFALSNVCTIPFVPWEDMDKLYNEHNIYLRLTKHDSLSTAVVEALACARHVIWTQPFPYCYQVANEKDLDRLLANQTVFKEPNRKGQRYVLEHFSLSLLRSIYQAAWQSITFHVKGHS